MKTMNLIINGNTENVQIERYFSALNHQYLIYSNEGADIDGNVRINVVKISDNKATPIDELEEWDALKKVIVGIVNDNRELSKLSVEDLDYHLLENLDVTDSKALRLPSAVMPYLSANQPELNSLEMNNQQLDAKVEALRDMNQDLTVMMDEVGKEFNEPIGQVEEYKEDEKMEATMEIIMPSKPIVASGDELKTSSKKEKAHFSFKNLFGKKKQKEEKIEEQPVVEQPTSVEEQPISLEEQPIEIQETLVEEPIFETISTDLPVANDIETAEISQNLVENTTAQTVVEPTIGFDFFETDQTQMIPEPIIVTPNIEMQTEIPDIPNIPFSEVEESTEILELEEDKYKALLEEQYQKVAELEQRISELTANVEQLQGTIAQYEQTLGKIKSIVD